MSRGFVKLVYRILAHNAHIIGIYVHNNGQSIAFTDESKEVSREGIKNAMINVPEFREALLDGVAAYLEKYEIDARNFALRVYKK